MKRNFALQAFSILALLLAPLVLAESADGEAQAREILNAIHDNTERKYQEVAGLPTAEQERVLDHYVDDSLETFFDLQLVAKQVFVRDWDAIVAGGLEDTARIGARSEMRENLQTTFESYERNARLKLTRVQPGRGHQAEIWISGLLGASASGIGRFPFTFIAMFYDAGERWLMRDMVFQNASMLEFSRTSAEKKIDRLGLEAALNSYGKDRP